MKLTILIGCFNEKQTILKAIKQAKAINVEKEIIVIDNCSTDGTKEVLEALSGDNDLKIIFHHKNMGAGYSAREGITLAQGDYFYGPLQHSRKTAHAFWNKLDIETLLGRLDIVHFNERIKL